MQDWDTVADVLAGRRTGQEARLRGWVHRQRSGGKIAFITLRDGTGTVQCTVKGGVADDESLAQAKDARIESSVSDLVGEVVEDERAPGGYEVRATRFRLHQRAEDFPLRGEQGTEFELDNRHLWLRSTQLSAVLRIKHRLYISIRRFFDEEGFREVDPSVITTNACEGGATLFTFDYFGQTAYLSQSAQMYLEGCIFGMPKVYSVTPSFRAEKSRTAKHLTEFHHLEAEAAWWTSEDNLAFQERMVERLAHDVAAECADDLRVLGQDPARLLSIRAPFPRMGYHEAAKRLRELGFDFPDGEDFGAPHETALTEGMDNPVFITDWPAEIKAFYMQRDPGHPDRVKCADLLAPDGYGEIIGGSQRSEDIAWMEERLWQQFVHEFLEEYPQHEIHEALLRTGFVDQGRPVPDEEIEEARRLHDDLHGHARVVPARVRQDGAPAALHEAYPRLREEVLRPYAWYFDLRRYGSVPHSGFGLGIERLLRWFTGQEHIRDMLPYPRTPSRAYP